MIGKKLSPILEEIEMAILEHEAYVRTKPEYSLMAFRAGIKIFSSVILDKMFELQINENMSLEDRVNMATKLGEEVRKLVKTFTGLETHDLYK